jgi:hypothetical protein
MRWIKRRGTHLFIQTLGAVFQVLRLGSYHFPVIVFTDSRRPMQNRPVKLIDWNQSLGTILVAALFWALTGYAIYDPSVFKEDDRPFFLVVIFIGPFLGAWALWRTVFWLEIGPSLCFQRIFGQRKYDWGQVRHLHLDHDTTRFLLGLIKITNRYIEFTVEENGAAKVHRFRVTKSSFPKVAGQILLYRPDLIDTAT